VIAHIVLLKWKPGVSDEQVLDAFSHARHIPNEVPGVQRISIGRHYGESKHGFTHAISVHLDDERALENYMTHPARLQYLAQYLDPIEEERIEIDVPTTMTLRPDPRRNWEWGASVGMGPPLEE
jgi:hypothetical protein